jgi:hypothetical protein
VNVLRWRTKEQIFSVKRMYLIENRKWMCYIDGQKNKYSVLNECNRMLKYNIYILGSPFVYHAHTGVYSGQNVFNSSVERRNRDWLLRLLDFDVKFVRFQKIQHFHNSEKLVKDTTYDCQRPMVCPLYNTSWRLECPVSKGVMKQRSTSYHNKIGHVNVNRY